MIHVHTNIIHRYCPYDKLSFHLGTIPFRREDKHNHYPPEMVELPRQIQDKVLQTTDHSTWDIEIDCAPSPCIRGTFPGTVEAIPTFLARENRGEGATDGLRCMAILFGDIFQSNVLTLVSVHAYSFAHLVGKGRRGICRSSHGELVASPIHKRWGLWRKMYEIRIEQLDKLLILDSDLMPPECKVKQFYYPVFSDQFLGAAGWGRGPTRRHEKGIHMEEGHENSELQYIHEKSPCAW